MTPSQTIGPFFHFSLTANSALGCLTGPEAKGERIRVRFRLLDGDGAPVPDGMIEIWQADASGKHDHPDDPQEQAPDAAFHGFGRLETDGGGCCVLDTVRPGRVPDSLGGRVFDTVHPGRVPDSLGGRVLDTAHPGRVPDSLGGCVLDTAHPGRVPDGRGGCQASHLNVSVFARGLLDRLCTRVYFEGDPALAEDPVLALVPEDRRHTLIARRDSQQSGQWNFEIHLQGEQETVFFEI